MKTIIKFLFETWIAPCFGKFALNPGQRVTTAAGRTGVVAFDNSANVQPQSRGVIVLYADNTYSEEINVTLTNVVGGWIPGTGPGN